MGRGQRWAQRPAAGGRGRRAAAVAGVVIHGRATGQKRPVGGQTRAVSGDGRRANDMGGGGRRRATGRGGRRAEVGGGRRQQATGGWRRTVSNGRGRAAAACSAASGGPRHDIGQICLDFDPCWTNSTKIGPETIWPETRPSLTQFRPNLGHEGRTNVILERLLSKEVYQRCGERIFDGPIQFGSGAPCACGAWLAKLRAGHLGGAFGLVPCNSSGPPAWPRRHPTAVVPAVAPVSHPWPCWCPGGVLAMSQSVSSRCPGRGPGVSAVGPLMCRSVMSRPVSKRCPMYTHGPPRARATMHGDTLFPP